MDGSWPAGCKKINLDSVGLLSHVPPGQGVRSDTELCSQSGILVAWSVAGAAMSHRIGALDCFSAGLLADTAAPGRAHFRCQSPDAGVTLAHNSSVASMGCSW